MNDNYLHTMYQLWEGDPSHLYERVGAKQFTPEIIARYMDFIFKGVGRHSLKGLNIGDYGCGVGRLTIPIAKEITEARVYGFDISEDMVDEANGRVPAELKKYVTHHTTRGDGIPDHILMDKYDFIYSVIALQHICSRRIVTSILRSFSKRLIPQGPFTIQVKLWEPHLRPWDYEPPANGVPEPLPLFTALPERFHKEEGNAYTPYQISKVCAEAGLKVDDIDEREPIDDHGTWLIVYGHSA